VDEGSGYSKNNETNTSGYIILYVIYFYYLNLEVGQSYKVLENLSIVY
jgi:hypothetical protein